MNHRQQNWPQRLKIVNTLCVTVFEMTNKNDVRSCKRHCYTSVSLRRRPLTGSIWGRNRREQMKYWTAGAKLQLQLWSIHASAPLNCGPTSKGRLGGALLVRAKLAADVQSPTSGGASEEQWGTAFLPLVSRNDAVCVSFPVFDVVFAYICVFGCVCALQLVISQRQGRVLFFPDLICGSY